MKDRARDRVPKIGLLGIRNQLKNWSNAKLKEAFFVLAMSVFDHFSNTYVKNLAKKEEKNLFNLP